MTGYGLISHQSKDLILEIEIKTINSKFFDFIFKSNYDRKRNQKSSKEENDKRKS